MNPRNIVLAASFIAAALYGVWYYMLLPSPVSSDQTSGSVSTSNFQAKSSNIKQQKSGGGGKKKTKETESALSLPVFPLEAQSMVVDDTEVFYKLPTTKNTRGVLIFFHGCNHGGQDFFLLPEDRVVAHTALERGLAVLSITSQNRKSGCWSKNKDLSNLHHAVETVLQHVDLSSKTLPRMGMGASSGGSFLFRAYEVLSFKSMASYVMWKSFDADDLANESKALPATAFIHMPRDPKSVDKVPQNSQVLKQRKVPSQVWQIHPHALDPSVCARRIPELGINQCSSVLQYAAEKHPEVLNDEYEVLEPYRGAKWDPIFEAFQNNFLARKANEKVTSFSGHSWSWAALVEEIAVSYAQHEMTAEHCDEVLDFLMVNAGIL